MVVVAMKVALQKERISWNSYGIFCRKRIFFHSSIGGKRRSGFQAPKSMMTRFSYSFVAYLATITVSFAATLCTQEEITQENLNKLASANNDLALNLHQQLSSGSSENVFFSPLSLSTAFGMLYYGTKGNAAEELRNVLGYKNADLPEPLVHRTFQQYLTEVLPTQDTSAYVLNSANSILLDQNLDVETAYKREVQDLYQASVRDVDFVTQGQKVVEDVNSWVKEKTNGKIEKLLDELDPSTALVLLNAIYFKGMWKTQFESERTKPETFYNNGLTSNAKEVPMMRLTEEFSYTSTSDAQVVELPYKGENVSMIIVLPNERDGLEAIEKGLKSEGLKTIRREMYKTKVILMLPKFKVEYSKEMSGDFQSLGAHGIFSPGADFSGMTPSKNIFVSQVLHKAVIDVNEEGSEAAAVTGIVSNRMKPMLDSTPEFVADHPFLFAIVDKRNDMILFMGRVVSL